MASSKLRKNTRLKHGLLLISALVVAACGITKPNGQNSDNANRSLRATAEKASNLSSLERQAYTRNTLLKFSEAEQNYREVIRLANELLPREQGNVEQESAEAMSLLLHLALNKSNLRQFDLAADGLRQVTEQWPVYHTTQYTLINSIKTNHLIHYNPLS